MKNFQQLFPGNTKASKDSKSYHIQPLSNSKSQQMQRIINVIIDGETTIVAKMQTVHTTRDLLEEV